MKNELVVAGMFAAVYAIGMSVIAVTEREDNKVLREQLHTTHVERDAARQVVCDQIELLGQLELYKQRWAYANGSNALISAELNKLEEANARLAKAVWDCQQKFNEAVGHPYNK